jgi:HTH-type transcriptional regulator/antitoxin HigA
MNQDSTHQTPGQLIQEVLQARGWSQRVLAVVVGCDSATLSQVIAGRRSVRADLAIALGEALGVAPERLLQLQASLDLAQAQLRTRPDPGRATRAHLFGGLPIPEMIKRRWLDAEDVRDVAKVEAALARFFGAASVHDIEVLPHAAKKTNVSADVTPAQLAWLYRVRQIAKDMLPSRFSQAAAHKALTELRNLLGAAEEVRKVPRILSEAGIRYVLVETLQSAKIDGVTLWLDERSPVIGMTLRFDRIDNFWFVLRHELEHVLKGHGKQVAMLDAELEGDRAGTGPEVSDEERVANEAAAEFCVQQQALARFIARKSPMFAERDLLGFARTIGVHPGLVAGQLQRRTGRYDLFRKHLVKVRTAVAPSALVDGWGDVAPVE